MSRLVVRLWHRGLVENVRFALGALVVNRLRSALTVLGIIIGVATVIAMVSVVTGFNNNVTRNFRSFGATLVQFQKFEPRFGPGPPGGDAEARLRKNLTIEDAAALKELCPSIRASSPERYWFAGPGAGSAPTVQYGGEEANPDLVAGVIEDYPIANNKAVGDGRFISAGDVRRSASVTVLGYEIAQTLMPRSDPLGKKVQISGRRYAVIGVMEPQPASFFESTDQHIYLPISTFDSHFPWIKRDRGVNIATVPKKAAWVDRVIEEGTAVLRTRRGVRFDEPNDFGILTPDKLIGSFRAVTSGITLTMIFISSIALVIGGVGVMNIMLVSVTERTREIGVRKAVGAVKRDIVTQFLIEAMTLTVIGGALGVAIGLGVSLVVGRVTPLPTTTPLWSVLVGLAVAATTGLFFGIYPAYRAANLDPIDALRYE